MEEITSERLLFEYIGRAIDRLSSVYAFVTNEISKGYDKEKISAASVEHSFLIKKLNAAIDRFKTEMKECLNDYIYMKKQNILRKEQASQYIKNQLDSLHTERDSLLKYIPENILEEKLGHNFYFHKNLNNLTADVLMDYFEVNYTMLLEKDLGKQ